MASKGILPDVVFLYISSDIKERCTNCCSNKYDNYFTIRKKVKKKKGIGSLSDDKETVLEFWSSEGIHSGTSETISKSVVFVDSDLWTEEMWLDFRGSWKPP